MYDRLLGAHRLLRGFARLRDQTLRGHCHLHARVLHICRAGVGEVALLRHRISHLFAGDDVERGCAPPAHLRLRRDEQREKGAAGDDAVPGP